ncbi:cyclophilin-like fold protein [Catenisphaera adipataccumulans]|uniref:Cyclophilin-like domain-containing protein n=1 Tax=Catenisphaera adipataccumulans TaxID=700500 RepID=A0A7W8CW55_9FIRM|nr:cyclophilin-like fold protein [Catenisphaera adipataccumulans]MBB5182706.1 hypothetical protein [Catenisphaera adipataccumulans]
MNNQSKNPAAKNAQIQTENPDLATRRPPADGTKIRIRFGDNLSVNGILNHCKTAQALVQQLPYTIEMARYTHDLCGITKPLPYQKEEIHCGWLNGDINYSFGIPYLMIPFKDEDQSAYFDYQVNIGVITSPLEELEGLNGTYDVTIERAEP